MEETAEAGQVACLSLFGYVCIFAETGLSGVAYKMGVSHLAMMQNLNFSGWTPRAP